jgi:hypothetical protein
MATPTYELIDSTTLATSASSVTFSGISATGKGDLVLVVDGIATGTDGYQAMRFNGDSSSAYSTVYMSGNGTSAASYAWGANALNKIALWGPSPELFTSSRTLTTISIADFSASDKHKSALIRVNNAANITTASANRWSSTAAITSIEIFTITTSWAAGSTLFLYQIVSE